MIAEYICLKCFINLTCSESGLKMLINRAFMLDAISTSDKTWPH